MKKTIPLLVLFIIHSSLTGYKKSPVTRETIAQAAAEQGFVTGRVTDAREKPIAGVKVVIEHTIWFGTYLYATTDNKGYYKVALPADPAGSWTAKAQVEKSAYGQVYTFDLHPGSTEPFNRKAPAIRDFTWKLSGKRPDAAFYYGAHLDLYPFGTDVPMNKIKVIFTPVAGEQLPDGSPALPIERTVEDVSGTFMAKDIPVGRYTVKAVYPGKTLLLDNRHDDKEPAGTKAVVFGRNGYLAKTDYNAEFWLSEQSR